MNLMDLQKKINFFARNKEWATFLLMTIPMKKLSLFASAAFLATSLSHAGGEGWMHDFEAAKAKAAKENKDLLIDFTGSDWCHWCVKLKEEVFDHDPFNEGVADKYVLVELDYPNDKSKQDEKTIKQNAELKEKYPVRGFPTILLTDAQGRPYAKTGYQRGGPDAYVTHLAELQKAKATRDEAFEKASKEEGVAKAKSLYAGLQAVPEGFRSLYPEVTAEIVKLDANDETGLAAAEKARKIQQTFESDLSNAYKSGDTKGALAVIDKHIADQDIKGEEKQKILTSKINALISVGDFETLDTVLDEIIAIDPDNQISGSVKSFREQRLPQIKAKKEAETTKEEKKDAEDK